MTNQVRKAFQKIGELPQNEQEEIANLILEELSWDKTFEASQDKLATLAKEAKEDYKSGKVSDQDWQ